MQLIIDEIKRHYILKLVSDEELLPFVEMAELEASKHTIEPHLRVKAKAYLALSFLGIKFWHQIQQRANEYDETLGTFKDVEKWEDYWRSQFYKLTTKKQGGINYAAI